MPIRRSHGRAALLAISAATLLVACSGSASGGPSTPARPGSSSAADNVPTSMSVAGSTDAPGSAGGNTDPSCALVTSDAVAKAAGFSIAKYSGGGGTCVYQNSDKSKYLAVQLFNTQADMATLLQLEPSGEHISSLGDDAFWVAGAGFLFVKKGDRGIELIDPDFALSSDTDTAPRDALVTLAQSALSNL